MNVLYLTDIIRRKKEQNRYVLTTKLSIMSLKETKKNKQNRLLYRKPLQVPGDKIHSAYKRVPKYYS